LKFRAIRCDFAMTLVARIRGEELVCGFGQPELEVVGSEGKVEAGRPRVAFVATGGGGTQKSLRVARW
jgi:hypothetical protein